MADTREARRGSFWIWATLVILAAAIIVAWLSARDRSDAGEGTIPPVETGVIGAPSAPGPA